MLKEILMSFLIKSKNTFLDFLTSKVFVERERYCDVTHNIRTTDLPETPGHIWHITHTQTHTHTHTHAHAHTYIHIDTDCDTHSHSHAYLYTLTHYITITYTQSYSLAFSLSLSLTHTHTHRHTHSLTHKSQSDRYPKISCCLPSYRTAQRQRQL